VAENVGGLALARLKRRRGGIIFINEKLYFKQFFFLIVKRDKTIFGVNYFFD